MQTVSLAKERPHLEGVFGPLNKARDTHIRALLSQVDIVLLQLARHFGRERAGHEGTGLELNWYPSGQVAIGSYVETGDGESHAAAFSLDLWPSWGHEDPSDVAAWIVEATIDVDCQHNTYHESMETVYSRAPGRFRTPEDAAQELLAAAAELTALVTDHPIEYWTSKTKG